jgi:hypothetical protein
MDTSVKTIEATYLRAKQWKAEGHKGEGPDGHLLRDIRGSCTGVEHDLADKYVKELQA